MPLYHAEHSKQSLVSILLRLNPLYIVITTVNLAIAMLLSQLLSLAAVAVQVGSAIPLGDVEAQPRNLLKRSVSPFYYDTTKKAINAMGQSYSTSSRLWTDITG